MLLRRLWGRILPLSRQSPMPEILGLEQFRYLLLRERSRADRVRSQLSLVVLDLSSAAVRNEALAELFLGVQARIRETDAFGWFDRRSLGILLPDTGATGAMVLAKDLMAKLRGVPPGTTWRVYSYPEDHLPPDPRWDGELRLPQSHDGRDSRRDTPSGVGSGGRRSPAPSGPPSPSGMPTRAGSRDPRIEIAPLRSVFFVRRSLLTRLMDIAVASMALVLVSPILLLAAIAVKLSSPGPVLFRQRRVGQWGQEFTLFKLRSMTFDAERRKQEVLALNEQEGPVFKCKADPRITPVGRFLRKTSIDELPQLWNVLKGEMTLVGPRPPLQSEVDYYEPWQRRRLEMRSGLTCIWQVSGRSSILFNDWVRLDLRYARRKSFWFDLLLLARTIPAVLTGRGAT